MVRPSWHGGPVAATAASRAEGSSIREDAGEALTTPNLTGPPTGAEGISELTSLGQSHRAVWARTRHAVR